MKTPQSPFAWPGGKRALKKRLLAHIPPHRIYVEVFAGSAKLLFAKQPSEREVMNDLNGEVTNFFRVAKHRPSALAEMFDHEIVHGGRFRELHAERDSADELQRALRFAYLAWYSYGAKGEHFAGSSAKGCSGGKVRRSLDRVRELLDRTAARLRNVLIEQRDFAEMLTRYDSPETWFYLDPPYVHFQANGRYEALSQERRHELFASLSAIAGKFLMSFDDCDEIRQLSRQHRFKIAEVELGYTLGSNQESRLAEWVNSLSLANRRGNTPSLLSRLSGHGARSRVRAPILHLDPLTGLLAGSVSASHPSYTQSMRGRGRGEPPEPPAMRAAAALNPARGAQPGESL